MSVASAIAAMKTGDYTVTRTAASTTDGHGRIVAGATSTFTIEASIQPVTDRDLKVLPEALHAEDLRKVFTVTELRAVPPDSITIGGEAWHVVGRPKRWEAFGSGHTEAIIARQAKP